MRILDIQVGELSLPLRHPFQTALRRVERLEDVVVRVRGENGLWGYGEAPPTQAITGETKDSILRAIGEHLAPALLGRDLMELDAVMDTLQSAVEHNTSAKAALDMALLDLWGKSLGAPLWQLLGGARSSLETDLTISAGSPEQMALHSREAVERSFSILKLKLGKDGGQDLERVLAVRRAVGPSIRLRLDANQGWTAQQAVSILSALEDAGVELDLAEQPVAAGDLAGLAYVTAHVHTPILADESVFSPADALEVIQSHAADLINIKLMKTGGIWPALRLCALAETFQVECMMGCMLESRLSVSAAAHLAAARAIITRADLDGPSLCADAPFTGGPSFSGPTIAMTDDPGIGVENIPCFHWAAMPFHSFS